MHRQLHDELNNRALPGSLPWAGSTASLELATELEAALELELRHWLLQQAAVELEAALELELGHLKQASQSRPSG